LSNKRNITFLTSEFSNGEVGYLLLAN